MKEIISPHFNITDGPICQVRVMLQTIWGVVHMEEDDGDWADLADDLQVPVAGERVVL